MRKDETARAPDGVIAVWKPAGWTSHDVVAKARRIVGVRRIGHTGTLDPAVTGVLPICVGRSTRLVEYLQEMPKAYEAVVRFGVATDTEDLEGRVVAESDASHLTADELAGVVRSFVGELDQTPPMVSAVKVDGKRLYEYAREGVTLARKSRRVTVYGIDVLETRTGERPEVRFRVRCSKGTYIRTLCVDIGRRLQTPAAMAKLVRIESAGLTEPDCVTIEQLAELASAGRLAEAVRPADRLLTPYPAATLDASAARDALQGKTLRLQTASPQPPESGLVRLYAPDGVFLGMFAADRDAGSLKPVKVFVPEGETSAGAASPS